MRKFMVFTLWLGGCYLLSIPVSQVIVLHRERKAGHAVDRELREATSVELPSQPSPENVVVHQLLRWHDCETNTVCYATSEGLDCVKDIDTPWLIAECGEETQ